MKVNITPGAIASVRCITLAASAGEERLELPGAFCARADDSQQAIADNEKAMPAHIFDLTYDLIENGPALSIIISEQESIICFAICHRDQHGWTPEEEEGVKEWIRAAFEESQHAP